MKLKELEDYHWFPAVLRKYQMEFIGILVSRFHLYSKVTGIIQSDMEGQGLIQIEDLCSGSGLPAIYIHHHLTIPGLTTTLTDKFPQKITTPKGIFYKNEAVDMNTLLAFSEKYYTLYNAFHHFNSEEQKTIVRKIIENKSNLLIVEIVQPSILSFLHVTLASTLGVIFMCPFIKPFDWKRIFFTYIIPINLITVLTDGFISILKSKTKKQYEDWKSNLNFDQRYITINENFQFPTYIITLKISGKYD